MIREEGGVLNPCKIVAGTRRNLKFGKNVHNYLKNQEVSRILRYFEIFFFC